MNRAMEKSVGREKVEALILRIYDESTAEQRKLIYDVVKKHHDKSRSVQANNPGGN